MRHPGRPLSEFKKRKRQRHLLHVAATKRKISREVVRQRDSHSACLEKFDSGNIYDDEDAVFVVHNFSTSKNPSILFLGFYDPTARPAGRPIAEREKLTVIHSRYSANKL